MGEVELLEGLDLVLGQESEPRAWRIWRVGPGSSFGVLSERSAPRMRIGTGSPASKCPSDASAETAALSTFATHARSIIGAFLAALRPPAGPD